MKKETISRCPVCGKQPVVRQFLGWYIFCGNLQVDAITYRGAVKRWNRIARGLL